MDTIIKSLAEELGQKLAYVENVVKLKWEGDKNVEKYIVFISLLITGERSE